MPARRAGSGLRAYSAISAAQVDVRARAVASVGGAFRFHCARTRILERAIRGGAQPCLVSRRGRLPTHGPRRDTAGSRRLPIRSRRWELSAARRPTTAPSCPRPSTRGPWATGRRRARISQRDLFADARIHSHERRTGPCLDGVRPAARRDQCAPFGASWPARRRELLCITHRFPGRELLAHAWDKAGIADSAAAHYAYVARTWSKADDPLSARAAEARAKGGSKSQ